MRPCWIVAIIVAVSGLATAQQAPGVLPTDAGGVPLNFDFESGTLKDWTAEGDAFEGMPIEGDAVAARRSDMKSRHAGRFWVGTYERKGDAATGTLTSVPFVATKPFASFLIGGGSTPGTCVEVVRKDSGRIVARVSGVATEDMHRAAVDLTPHVGKEVFVRVVDRGTVGWGHINFDDFRLHDTRPASTAPLPPDVIQYAGLPPEKAAAAMTVPEGFRVTLFAGEPDVYQPIAFAIDDRGRLWVAEAYSYPFRQPPEKARDRIVIFEDKDNDGKFDGRKVFAERLNLVSGLELGFGGVYVGAAPDLPVHPRQGRRRPARRASGRPARRLGVGRHARGLELVHLGPRWLALRLPWRVHALARRQARHARRRADAHQRRDLAIPPDPPRLRGLRPGDEQPLGRRLRPPTAMRS